jgi:cytochrome P450
MTENTEKSKRRRMWEPAFTPTAVKSYQPMLEGPLSALVTDITNKSSKEIPVQLQDALMKVAFNFMGMFAYGGALPAEETGWQDIMIHAGLEGTAWCDVFGATPWIRPILPLAPSTKVTQFHNAAAVAAENRRRVGSKFRDLMFYLVGGYFPFVPVS